MEPFFSVSGLNSRTWRMRPWLVALEAFLMMSEMPFLDRLVTGRLIALVRRSWIDFAGKYLIFVAKIALLRKII